MRDVPVPSVSTPTAPESKNKQTNIRSVGKNGQQEKQHQEIKNDQAIEEKHHLFSIPQPEP